MKSTKRGEAIFDDFTTIRQLFRAKSRWTRGALAKTKTGGYCTIKSERAAAFCLSGAIARVYPKSKALEIQKRLVAAIRELFPKESHIIAFNDKRGRTIQQIRAVVKRAKV